METNKILSASFIDILFEGRNKNYGAYELRKKYGSRLSSAIVGTIAFASLVVFASFISSRFENKSAVAKLDVTDVELTKVIDEPEVATPPPPPPPPPAEQPRIAMSQYTAPLLVHEEIKPEEQMKDVTEIADTKIGTANVDGLKGVDITAPPIEEGSKSGVITGPKKDKQDETLIDVQIQAKFPGGDEEWRQYISKQINRYMDELEEEGKAGSCVVQFIVDIDGSISNVEALTMKGTKLAEICVNAVRKGPNWTPAENNGKKVKAYRKQPVVFQINN
ncbi:MAG: energy transducer TonB [Agriterribacter sp.]